MFASDDRHSRLRPAVLISSDRVIQSLLRKGLVHEDEILEAAEAYSRSPGRERTLWRVLAARLPDQRPTILREAAQIYGYRDHVPALSDVVDYLHEQLQRFDHQTWSRLIADRMIPVAHGNRPDSTDGIVFGADDPTRRRVRKLFDELAPRGSELRFLRPPLVTFLTRRLIPSLLEPQRRPLEARIFKPKEAHGEGAGTGSSRDDLRRAA
jgi:hypothetical protein